MTHYLPASGRLTSFASLVMLLLNIALPAAAQIQTQSLEQTSPVRHDMDFSEFPDFQYRSPANELYWKRDKPRPGYWQQDIHYQIDVELVPEANLLDGRFRLTYWNNSPDTLQNAYFHLYQNAFTKGSYYEQYQKDNKVKPEYSVYEKEGLGTTVKNIQHAGNPADTALDNSILKVELNEPLPPGEKTTFSMDFVTYFGWGSQRRRMKVFNVLEQLENGDVHTVKHFDCVLWYPRIAVYDHKFRWHTDQHLSKEFYGEYGTFDVKITTPHNYILGGTGTMINRSEVLPQSLRDTLALANYADKPMDEPATQILAPDDGPKRTYKFHATNVHDFAFTTDPTYRIGHEETKNGVDCYALVREPNAAGWQDAPGLARDIIELFSEDFGEYEYPKVIVADAKDGMEYPMVTLDGGTSPSYRDLIVHEIGHMWFHSMLGNNETYRAYMDEGFTQFLTAYGMNELFGHQDPKDPQNHRYTEVYYWYILQARKGYNTDISKHSDHFQEALSHGGGYGQVYYKFATMLFSLQYTLGDELFREAMRNYVDQWKIAHPYPEDFRQSITDYTQTDLTWFFDQWMTKAKRIDYAVSCVKKSNGGRTVEITFKRKGEGIMPVNFTVVTKGGDSLRYLIPNYKFAKDEPGRTVLDKWYGWGDFNKKHTVKLELEGQYDHVVIDASRRLPDINLLNNSKGNCFEKIDFSFMGGDSRYPDWQDYKLNMHPKLWYNGYAGLIGGLTLEGQYYGYSDDMSDQHDFSLSGFYNSGYLQRESRSEALRQFEDDYQVAGWRFRYETPLLWAGRNIQVHLRSDFQDGLHYHAAQLSKRWAEQSQTDQNYRRVYGGYQYLLRPKQAWRDYLIYPQRWNVDEANARFTLGFEHNYKMFSGNGNWKIEGWGAGPGSDVKYAAVRYRALHTFKLFDKLKLRTRLFGQYADGNLPAESQLYLAGASPEEYYDNDFFRARGFFPDAMVDNNGGRTTNNIHYGGGLNLRGYAGYEAEFANEDPAYRGSTGGALNLELEFQRLSPWRLHQVFNFLRLKTYAFYDLGVLGTTDPDAPAGDFRGFDPLRFDKIRQDAGLGAALNVNAFDTSADRRPFTIRADFPLLLSNPPATEDFVQFRWMIGIERAF